MIFGNCNGTLFTYIEQEKEEYIFAKGVREFPLLSISWECNILCFTLAKTRKVKKRKTSIYIKPKLKYFKMNLIYVNA